MDRNTSPKVTIKPRTQPSEGQALRSLGYRVTVGDWELGRGVLDFKLEMPAGTRPKATITFYPESVDVEVAAADVEKRLQDFIVENQKQQEKSEQELDKAIQRLCQLDH